MEVIFSRIATRPPPVFPDDLIRKIPDEIDLTGKILEATFLVAILESIPESQNHTFLWFIRKVLPEGECLSIPN